jgi:cytochrome c biogenesis protein CcdA
MAVEAILPSLTTVIVTALIDSINPCAIGVKILLISTLLATGASKKKIFKVGMLYISAVFITYFIAGLGLTFFFSQIPQVYAQYISITVGILVVLGGLVEIKDFYWYGKGFSLSIPVDKAKQIHEKAANLSTKGIVGLGIFVAGVELPCTGGPYLAITLLLSQNFDINAFMLLLLYNFIFVLPLLAILGLVLAGKNIVSIKKWKQGSKPFMRLMLGLLLVALGWLLILIANGTIFLE